jgi:predicted metal-dependent phosphoesterase TrpH
MRFDLHVHSAYSHDSFLRVDTIVKLAKKRNLQGVAVVDHNATRGGFEALKANSDPDFTIVVGAEIQTDYGDVIGLFLNEDVRSRQLEEVLEEIRVQGGLSVLAHPYRQYAFPEEIAAKMDALEGFNARSRKQDNERAYQLALKYKKPMTSGSDVHLGCEIGKGVTIVDCDVEDALKKGKTQVEGRESRYYLAHGASAAMEKIKSLLER